VADKSVDSLMKLVDSSGALTAESQSRFNMNDEFMQGFALGKFFDVMNFDFGVKLSDTGDDEGGSSGGSSGGKSRDKEKDKDGRSSKRRGSSFARWLGSTGSLKNAAYPVEVDEFEVKRMFDIASPTLFQICANSSTLKSATLVQRKSGSSQSTMGIAPCHLRIDFYDVLLTAVSWDVEDQGIEEKLKFVCRKISVQYKPQKPDGTLGAAVHGEWQFDASSSGS
jgi:type VI secretion system secreted protein Hcp